MKNESQYNMKHQSSATWVEYMELDKMNLEVPSIRIRVAAVLRKSILSGELKSGQELSLTETAANLGISRTPVREAFQLLESEGLLVLRANKGAIVRGISSKFIEDHFKLRILLECEAVIWAIRNGIDTDRLEACNQQMRSSCQAMDQALYQSSNQLFHQVIWEAADNQRLTAVLQMLWNGPSIGKAASVRDHMLASAAEHEEILQYMAENQPVQARSAMERHLRRSMQNLLDSFAEYRLAK